jgi:hypothetical protein
LLIAIIFGLPVISLGQLTGYFKCPALVPAQCLGPSKGPVVVRRSFCLFAVNVHDSLANIKAQTLVFKRVFAGE